MQRLLSQIGRSQRLEVVNHLKRSDGLAVRELAKRLGMSYMGAKQICLNLEKDGYLETTRRHRGVGRPELLYHLTNKAKDLFPQADNTLVISLLEQARVLFGSSAGEKLLFRHFQERAEGYLSRIRGESLAERAEAFARVREKEGHMAEFQQGPPLQIVERHSPIQAILMAYPNVATMEKDLYQRVLGASVKREQKSIGAEYECVFSIG